MSELTYFVFREADGRAVACFSTDDKWQDDAAEGWANAALTVVSRHFYSDASSLAATLLCGLLMGSDAKAWIVPVEDAFYSAGTVVLIEATAPFAPAGVRPAVRAGAGEEIHELVDPEFAAIRQALQ